jgi:F0F1-type ATP synthase membrane subunit b/b'
MMQTMEARLAEVQDGLGGADGGEGDAQALLQQAETLLSQVADQVSAAQALLDRIRDAAEYVQGNDQE